MSNKVKPLRTERFPRKLVHQRIQPREYNVKTRDTWHRGLKLATKMKCTDAGLHVPPSGVKSL
jgi:hypothetical protein